IQYSINSIPVASTFTPAKGKAKSLQRAPKERFYNNYASLAYGLYNTVLFEAFAHSNTSNYNDFGGFLNYHGSAGGIDGVELEDDFSKFKADLFYKQTERNFEWLAEAGYNRLSTNWYGLPEALTFTTEALNAIAENQTYNEIYIGGEVEIYDALAQSGKIKLSRFFDKKKSVENYGFISGIVDFPVRQEMIYTEMSFEFLNSTFDNDYFKTNDLKSTFFNIGFKPNLEVLRDNLTLNLGGRLYYSITDTKGGSKFFAYPNVTASYKITEESLIAYAGVIGDLQQNSYKSFANKNPFVSPTLNIHRTSQQYNAYGGIKGLLNSNIRFNFKASYINEADKPLYLLNPSKTNGTSPVDEGYEAANSFQVIYDDVNTINVIGELIVDFNQAIKFGGNFEFNTYNLDTQTEAWNLPMVKATLLANYTHRKWYAGAELFFASERKDIFTSVTNDLELITNKAYIDLNFSGLYNLNDKIVLFLNVNNILSDNYQEYSNFKVQGLQVIGGVKFKFDL
ncbi:MAG: TonB-dependent receptor, partial [Flavobacteriaceae bacterium]|nr:TonB-dependent receptor [Flavobacteriaceae bacterium]